MILEHKLVNEVNMYFLEYEEGDTPKDLEWGRDWLSIKESIEVLNIAAIDEIRQFGIYANDNKRFQLICNAELTEQEQSNIVSAFDSYETITGERNTKLALIRNQRNAKIEEVEWVLSKNIQQNRLVQLGLIDANDITDEKETEVLNYIQKLREVPQSIINNNYADIDTFEWPVKPSI